MSCAAENPPAALQRLGISKEAMRAIAWKNNIQARAEAPAPEIREYHSPRLINTRYLDGEQQRAKKAMLQANEAVIVGLVMQGLSVIEIALAFGVTDQAIRNRVKDFGVKPPGPVPSVGGGLRRWLDFRCCETSRNDREC